MSFGKIYLDKEILFNFLILYGEIATKGYFNLNINSKYIIKDL